MSMATRSRTRSRSHLPRSQSHQAGIQRFTKTSKPGALAASKSLLLLDGGKEVDGCAVSSCQLPTSPSKKRKLNEITISANNEAVDSAASCSTQKKTDSSVEDTPSKTLKFCDLSVSTPHSSRARTSKSTHTRSIPQPPAFKKPTSSISSDEHATISTQRPAAFTEFIDLHSSFLKALALYSAHNGYSSTADLRELLPSIEKIWKKRKVVAKDLQRIVQIWDEDVDNRQKEEKASVRPRFRIADYGLGKICIERLDRSTSVSGAKGMFDENRFQEIFVQLLEKKWKDQGSAPKNMAGSKESEGNNNVVSDESPFDPEKLDLAPIHDCLTPYNTFQKGQQRLQDLRGGVIKVKTAMMKAASTSAAGIDVVLRDPVADRRKGLFERIKNKELLQAKLGPPPTKEQILRRSASQRVEDVVKVLALLRPSPTITAKNSLIAQRTPFMWHTLIQTIKDSLRNPIPAEEIGACLDILAQKDVAGDWIDIVTVGNLKSVILMSCRDVSPKEIGVKVGKMQF